NYFSAKGERKLYKNANRLGYSHFQEIIYLLRFGCLI
ncbi:hypothetical protein NT05LI_0967a, partial [Listeria ivanovii FSL F6-596]